MSFEPFNWLVLQQRIAAGALLVGLLLSFETSSSVAASTRIQGTIEQSDAHSMTVLAADGSQSKLELSSSTLVLKTRPSELAAIKPGDYVASAATKGDDGKLHST